jgi:hypothetical protein
MELDLQWDEPQYRDMAILDFDMESLAAGFADPAWVPQKITCISWSWVGYDAVNSVISTQMGFFIPSIRANALAQFMPIFNQADMVTGHNLLRHDLPLLRAECLYLGIEPPKAKLVQDTIRIGKSKGLKKGLDNLGGMLMTQEEKQAMDWAAWEKAYEDPTWQAVIDRCESDVRLHKEVRAEMLRRGGWLKKPVTWSP